MSSSLHFSLFKYVSNDLADLKLAITIVDGCRRCPTLDITLCFEHCHCDSAPISSFGNETFPRVRRLILYVGNQDPEETHQRRARCVPNAKFWRPFVNGSSFPDCVDLEVHHYWATKPPDGASLDLGVSDYFVGRGSPGVIGRSEGLERLESIFLEKPPELDSSILMQLLGNPKSMASNLKTLELRFCKLDSQTIAQLLYHAPPNLKRVVLLCQDDRQFTHEHHDDQEQRQHLCPLIREFSKNLNHIEFGAASICRELFFDDLERQELELNDIITTSGSPTESSVSNNSLDGHAIRRAVEDCRQRKRMNHRNDRVKQAIIACQANTITSTNHTSLFGESIKPTAAAFKAQRDTETLLDEEEQTRKRLIEGSTPKWFRRFISWHGLCFPSDTWAEMQLAADLEEEGIEWVLASMFSLDARRTRTVAAPANGAKDKVLQVASHHSNGKPSATLDYERALEEKYRLGV